MFQFYIEKAKHFDNKSNDEATPLNISGEIDGQVNHLIEPNVNNIEICLNCSKNEALVSCIIFFIIKLISI